MGTIVPGPAGVHFGEPVPLPTTSPVSLGSAPTADGSGSTLAPMSGAGLNLESIRITSASDLSASQPNEYLVGLILEGGQKAGWLANLYNGVDSAILPSLPSGLDATGAIGPAQEVLYPTNIKLDGTLALKGASLTFGGGLTAVRGLFSNRPNPTPNALTDWSTMRGVAVTGDESGTSGTAKTYTMPGGKSLSPKAITAMMSIDVGTATGIPSAEIGFPVLPPFASAYAVPARFENSQRAPYRWPVPSIGPATSYSLTHKAISLGAATDIQVMGILWV